MSGSAGAPRRPVLVAVAWPYANGPLHLGHVAGSLLPPDLFARYHRMAGSPVLMVSGSDMHGTPILLKAEQEGVPPQELAARYHREHVEALSALDIRFDLFTTTATKNHADTVHDVFGTLLARGDIARRTMRAPYDPKAKRFLPDRYVEGTCPHCRAPDARGDQCDACGRTLDPQELLDPRSKVSGAAPEFRDTEHFFLLLPRFSQALSKWTQEQAKAASWRPNTIHFTRNWLSEGLKERAITRDMTYGVRLPAEIERQDPSLADKRVYVWFEAVVGYLSAAKEWAQREGKPDAWREWWVNPRARHYYFLGKDNIPFHTIVWPAMILGYANGKGEAYQLPWDVPANEFMTFSGSKFSKSRGNLILVKDATDRFQADAVRYYLCANMPESRDADFLWEEFARKVNDELVAAFGNFCHRTLTFAHANFEGAVPRGGSGSPPPATIAQELAQIGPHLEACRFKDALKSLMAAAMLANKWFQELAPWQSLKQDKERCGADVRELLSLVKTFALCASPFLPRAAQDLWEQLGEEGEVASQRWPSGVVPVPPGQRLGAPRALFRKIDLATMKDLLEGTPVTPSSPPSAGSAPKGPAAQPPARTPLVSIDEFAKLDLRVGLVTSVEDHPKADKLYVLKVDLGDGERQIVAGLRGHVAREALLGKRVVIVANLAPATLRGVESQGMLLAAEDAQGRIAPLAPAADVDAGAKVR
ncbi:MAG TPA: methionine--tRNA ligase [Candidatus Thermoplasmatota archaeon]|nr:methionine--tRNA ligase [Candidatus Thermoplasmatota archaeon]